MTDFSRLCILYCSRKEIHKKISRPRHFLVEITVIAQCREIYRKVLWKKRECYRLLSLSPKSPNCHKRQKGISSVSLFWLYRGQNPAWLAGPYTHILIILPMAVFEVCRGTGGYMLAFCWGEKSPPPPLPLPHSSVHPPTAYVSKPLGILTFKPQRFPVKNLKLHYLLIIFCDCYGQPFTTPLMHCNVVNLVSSLLFK